MMYNFSKQLKMSPIFVCDVLLFHKNILHNWSSNQAKVAGIMINKETNVSERLKHSQMRLSARGKDKTNQLNIRIMNLSIGFLFIS